jgi:D-lactate dehydrogenase (cytochrome)
MGLDARNKLWAGRHHLFETSLRYYPGYSYLLTDVAVPISAYPELVNAAAEKMADFGLAGSMVGHAGDGNLHTIIFFPAEDDAAREKASLVNDHLVAKAISLGGTSTGEHGVGIGKIKYMSKEHGETALDVMRQIKAVFDPNNILNPGKILG